MTEEIRYIAKLQRQEEFDNEVTELKDELKRLEQENKQMKSALEEIREMVLYCEDEYNCDRCKYHDNCLIDDDKFPDFSKALVNKINEVLQ